MMTLDQIKTELAEMDSAYAAYKVNETPETKARFDIAQLALHMDLAAKLHLLIDLAAVAISTKEVLDHTVTELDKEDYDIVQSFMDKIDGLNKEGYPSPATSPS